jgi:LmbE family N-acetylglucosaminyl deacetylase
MITLAVGLLSVALTFTSAADETAKRESVLVVSAHPDDSIAMAGTMFLMKDKFDIHIADLTKGQARDLSTLGHDGPQAERRVKEEEAAAALVGAKVHWLGFQDGRLYATPEACRAVADLVAAVKPRAIFSMWPIDRHQDHSMAGTITLKGAMLAKFKGEFYYYEEVYGSKGFVPMHFVDVSSVAEMKRKYLRCHESQNDGDYLLNVEMHGAKGRGYQAMYSGGREFAECFAPLAGFHVQGSRCIFNELSSPKGGEH